MLAVDASAIEGNKKPRMDTAVVPAQSLRDMTSRDDSEKVDADDVGRKGTLLNDRQADCDARSARVTKKAFKGMVEIRAAQENVPLCCALCAVSPIASDVSRCRA